MSEERKDLTAYHEAGHVVLQYRFNLHPMKVSIIPTDGLEGLL
jgi:ATP-dependent Zn protease